MKKLLILLSGSILFVTGIYSQMLVQGDVVNIGDAMVANGKDLVINAAHDGSDPIAGNNPTKATGIVDNQADGGKKLQITGDLVLHSVSWNISHKNKAKGADGIFLSNPAASATPTETTGAKVVKYLKAKGYYYFSLPFDVPENGISNTAGAQYYPYNDQSHSDGYWIQEYDTDDRAKNGLLGAGDGTLEGNTGWVGFGSVESTQTTGKNAGVSPQLNAGQTYCIWIDKPGFYTFTSTTPSAAGLFGTAVTQYSRSKALNYTTALYHPNHPERYELNYGWHGVGCMQTSPFHLSTAVGTNVLLDGSGNGVNNIYVYDYTSKTWVPKTIVAIDSKISIAPYSGLMVQIPANKTITFKGAGRQTTTAATHFRSATQSTIPYLGLQLYKAKDISPLQADLTDADALKVIIMQGSSNDFNSGEDGLKFFAGTTYKAPEFAVLAYNGAYTVAITNNFRSSFEDKEEIPVSLWIKEDGNYTIQLTNIQGFDKTVYLIDKTTSTMTELTSETSYNFQARATDQPINDRFALRVGSTTDMPATVFNKTVIYAADNRVYVTNGTIGDNVFIYTTAGRLVASHIVETSSTTSFPLPVAGIYVVKVTGTESVVAKVIIK